MGKHNHILLYIQPSIEQLLREQAKKKGLNLSSYIKYLIVMEKVRELEQKGEFDSEE